MTIQQSIERFNSLPKEQKQEIWSKAIENLSNVNLEELSNIDINTIEGGTSSWPPPGWPFIIIWPYLPL